MTSDPWRRLGVSRQASESEIRRAYARLLRTVRPDDDPEGFQRLVEARDHALWYATLPDEELADWDDETAPAPEEAPTPRPAPEDTMAPVATAEQALKAVAPLEKALADLDQVLAHPELAGWQHGVTALGHLSMAEREAASSRVLGAISDYTRRAGRPFAGWHFDRWPFFELAANLDAEFAWLQRDRFVYDVLEEDDAVRLLELLRWVRDVGPASGRIGISRVAADDLRAFYTGGRNVAGIVAYRQMAGSGLPLTLDPVTLFFIPGSSGRHWLEHLGDIVGLLVLLLAYAPWNHLRGSVDNLQLTYYLDGATGYAAFAILVWQCLLWGNFYDRTPEARQRNEALSLTRSTMARLLGPIWCALNGLPTYAFVIALAWGALATSLFSQFGHPILAAPLVLTLHQFTARYGQQWVIAKLLRSVQAADRLGLRGDARANFLRRRGTHGVSNA